jgi:hypothetical protein
MDLTQATKPLSPKGNIDLILPQINVGKLPDDNVEVLLRYSLQGPVIAFQLPAKLTIELAGVMIQAAVKEALPAPAAPPGEPATDAPDVADKVDQPMVDPHDPVLPEPPPA